jgi:mycofactocin precursor
VNDQSTIEAPPATTRTSDVASDVEPITETAAEQLVEETLVEEVSIDGMCGVY